MITLKNIKTVKEQRDIETDNLQGYIVNEGINVPLNNDLVKVIKQWSETNEITPAYTEEERLEYFKNKLLNQIQSISDSKRKELKSYVAGIKLTPEQQEGYELKYQSALLAKENSDYSVFELEAKLQNLEAQELVDLIIQNHDEWMQEIQDKNLLVESYRVKAKSIINDNFDSVEKYKLFTDQFNKAKDFSIETDAQTIEDFFTNFQFEIPEEEN